MKELIKKVEQWSIERGLNTADPNKQRLKLWEEFGELNAAIARDNRDGAIDAIGDMLVVLIIYKRQLGFKSKKIFYPKKNRIDSMNARLGNTELINYVGHGIVYSHIYNECLKEVTEGLTVLAYRLGTNLEECLSAAYDVIKDRKGKMINGVFVKEEDLNG